MFHEDVGRITAEHLREHIEGYLAQINERYGDPVNLTVPKSIEVTSVVGGLFKDYDNILPQYGIDVLNKEESPSADNLWTYVYTGQINGMVHGTSDNIVDQMIHRHGAAVEQFVREHYTLHQDPADLFNQAREFTITKFLFSNIEWSGAEDLGEVDGRQIWLGAFSLNCLWEVSENGPGQHGSP